jgi:hypothetical protein
MPAPHVFIGSHRLTLSERLEEIRTGFERPFWVANISEIFERLSYYGAFASLALYLQEKLNFSTEQTGTLTGIFGGMVWFLAIFGGAAADRLGFRRAQRNASDAVRRIHPDFAGAWNFAGQALCCGDNGARF